MPKGPHRSRRGSDERVDAAVEKRVGEANVRKRAAIVTVAVILGVVLIRHLPRWMDGSPSTPPATSKAALEKKRAFAAKLLKDLELETTGGAGELEAKAVRATPAQRTSRKRFYVDLEVDILNDGLGDDITAGVSISIQSAKGTPIGFEVDLLEKKRKDQYRSITFPADKTTTVRCTCAVNLDKADEIRGVSVLLKRR